MAHSMADEFCRLVACMVREAGLAAQQMGLTCDCNNLLGLADIGQLPCITFWHFGNSTLQVKVVERVTELICMP